MRACQLPLMSATVANSSVLSHISSAFLSSHLLQLKLSTKSPIAVPTISLSPHPHCKPSALVQSCLRLWPRSRLLRGYKYLLIEEVSLGLSANERRSGAHRSQCRQWSCALNSALTNGGVPIRSRPLPLWKGVIQFASNCHCTILTVNNLEA